MKLVDLARQMVELSGCTVRDSQKLDGDIAITFTGLRPGEKLYEDLLISHSDQPTKHPLIRQAEEAGLGNDKLAFLLDQLSQSLANWDREKSLSLLKSLVNEYQAGIPFDPANDKL